MSRCLNDGVLQRVSILMLNQSEAPVYHEEVRGGGVLLIQLANRLHVRARVYLQNSVCSSPQRKTTRISW